MDRGIHHDSGQEAGGAGDLHHEAGSQLPPRPDLRDFLRRAGRHRRQQEAQRMKSVGRLTPQQRRRLVLLTGLFGAALIILLVDVLRAWSNLPALPALAVIPTQFRAMVAASSATPTQPAAAEVVAAASSQAFGIEAANPPLPTPTPSAYLAYLPGLGKVMPTPAPTQAAVFYIPPPAPGWPNAQPRLSASKLGVHVIRNNDPNIMEFVRRVHPRVMKAVDDLGWLADVKAASSPTITIGRLSDQDETWPDKLAPAEAARQYIAGQMDRYRLNTGVDYWEGWNEYRPTSVAHWNWYAAFEAERACQMQAVGLRAAVGGFSVGVPEYHEMALFMPALEAAHRCGGIFTLHEYNSPTLQCGLTSDIAGVIPGAPKLSTTGLGHHTLRYRFWYEGYLKPRGLGDLPLVISELGIQGPGVNCGDNGGMLGGWQTYRDWWVQQGYASDGSQAYVNMLAWYDAEMHKDPYVLGATIFTAGAREGSNEWSTFDVHDALAPLAFYAVALVEPPASPTPSGPYPPPNTGFGGPPRPTPTPEHPYP